MIKLKTLATGFTAIFLSAAVVGCASTPLDTRGMHYPNGTYDKKGHNTYKQNKKHQNKKYNKSEYNQGNAERLATRKLNAMGYQVQKVDYKQKQGIVKTTAYRGGKKYKIDLAYPSMNVVKMKKD
ncbi:hypothetical protein DLE54_05800 [Psychrobacter sp. YP14]|uniref:PepSY domain-containing protein n=1 Tax=Psychrobacter sp. YP14 TaxID=2203895 RepID=UPI000D7E38F4|nr:PepSY domain-containing protein [Psychrobacter sp. YP14]AWT49086.1 hypothetical protein DLE54_05800 [Psychrobacter sp. YP14]